MSLDSLPYYTLEDLFAPTDSLEFSDDSRESRCAPFSRKGAVRLSKSYAFELRRFELLSTDAEDAVRLMKWSAAESRRQRRGIRSRRQTRFVAGKCLLATGLVPRELVDWRTYVTGGGDGGGMGLTAVPFDALRSLLATNMDMFFMRRFAMRFVGTDSQEAIDGLFPWMPLPPRTRRDSYAYDDDAAALLTSSASHRPTTGSARQQQQQQQGEPNVPIHRFVGKVTLKRGTSSYARYVPVFLLPLVLDSMRIEGTHEELRDVVAITNDILDEMREAASPNASGVAAREIQLLEVTLKVLQGDRQRSLNEAYNPPHPPPPRLLPLTEPTPASELADDDMDDDDDDDKVPVKYVAMRKFYKDKAARERIKAYNPFVLTDPAICPAHPSNGEPIER
jgi:hypothetical protein